MKRIRSKCKKWLLFIFVFEWTIEVWQGLCKAGVFSGRLLFGWEAVGGMRIRFGHRSCFKFTPRFNWHSADFVNIYKHSFHLQTKLLHCFSVLNANKMPSTNSAPDYGFCFFLSLSSSFKSLESICCNTHTCCALTTAGWNVPLWSLKLRSDLCSVCVLCAIAATCCSHNLGHKTQNNLTLKCLIWDVQFRLEGVISKCAWHVVNLNY